MSLLTTEEIRMVVRQINGSKSAGPDNILGEAMKTDIQATVNIYHIVFRTIWEG